MNDGISTRRTKKWGKEGKNPLVFSHLRTLNTHQSLPFIHMYARNFDFPPFTTY